MASLSAWFRDRIPIHGDQLRELSNEPVPNHLKRWWFCLGGTPAYLFIVQVFTGILLAFYYRATPASAWESIDYITNHAAYGWYLRSLHKWSATMMIAAVVLHQMRVFFTGAYRKPRELNWIVGMCLLLLTLLLGFTGYSLVYEQLSYWGATVGANITFHIPLVGGMLKSLLLGGETFNDRTLSRYFMLHAAVLPALMIALMFLHFTLIRLQGVTEFHFPDEPRNEPHYFNFFPDHFLTELTIGLVLMVLLSALAVTLPAEMGPKANPLVTPELIKPEWYFYVVYRWLKLFSATVAILGLGLVLFLMFAWPFIDAWVRRRWKGSEFSVYFGVLAVIVLLTFTVWEGAVAH